MKKTVRILSAIALVGGLFFMQSCKDETCNDGILNQDETEVDCGGVCDACPTCTDGIMNGNETGIDCGGDCDACPTCDDGIQNGDETGIDCGGSCAPCKEGAMGSWQSSGSDVAPLLALYFGVDSIYAEFNTDMTYYVEQYDTNGVKLTLEGTYTQSLSNVDGIYTITVLQSSPSTLTSEGILKVENGVMQYEIVQTEPDISAVPPTPSAGFGSTNGGVLGTSNVQVYRSVN